MGTLTAASIISSPTLVVPRYFHTSHSVSIKCLDVYPPFFIQMIQTLRLSSRTYCTDPCPPTHNISKVEIAENITFLSQVEIAAKVRAGGVSRMAVTGLLFEKLLRTRAIDGQNIHSGELASLFSTDADCLADLWHGALTAVLQPLEIVGCVGLLTW